MGLSIDSTHFFVQAWKNEVRFDETLTLGRQMMLLSAARIEEILQSYAAWPPPQGAAGFHQELERTGWRFEIFARALGAKTVSACDVSGYEGATLVHGSSVSVKG